jgi:hypothetical protein
MILGVSVKAGSVTAAQRHQQAFPTHRPILPNASQCDQVGLSSVKPMEKGERSEKLVLDSSLQAVPVALAASAHRVDRRQDCFWL